MAADKFRVFGNNMETAGVQDQRAWCRLPEGPLPPRGPEPLLPAPGLVAGGGRVVVPEDQRSLQKSPWESSVRAVARGAMPCMA